MSDNDMGENEDNSQWDSPFKNLLLLGAIAAASAFVVTILIVLVCVGCQRKSKSKHPPAGEKGTSVNMQGTLRHPKLNSMSKSDTRLHEINRFPCNGNFSKSRPASMDLLLLHSRRSQTDLRPSHGRQLPQIPTSPPGSGQDSGGETGTDPEAGLGGGGGGGEARDHTYTEVGIRSNPTPTHPLDDGLYETVGVRDGEAGHKITSAPPSILSNSPASVRAAHSPPAQANGARGGNGFVNNGRGNGRINGGNGTIPGRANSLSGMNRSPLSSVNSLTNQEPGGVEYASVRKFRKVEKSSRKENNGGDSQSDQSSVSDSPSAPPLHRSQEFPRKPLEPFHIHSFPKEAVFMGNGEQYIWKPPEEDDIITLHPPPHRGDNAQGHPSPPTAKEIAETYSIVCKNQRKKPPMENNGAKTLPRSFGGGRGRGKGVQVQARSQEEPCYEPMGSWSTCAVAEPDPSYATVDSHRKREQATNNSPAGGSATLKRKKQQQQQQAAAPAQGSGPASLPVRGLPGGEHFYESISDVKAGANSSSTTTIFTFNDGMEMYVTGL